MTKTKCLPARIVNAWKGGSLASPVADRGGPERGADGVRLLRFAKKVLLVGDAAVGKTSIARRYLLDAFSDRYIATIGTKTARKSLLFEYEEPRVNVELHLGIWDILGQIGMERAHAIYFPGADGAVFVCDLTRPDTLRATEVWAERVRAMCGSIPAVLAANQVDRLEDRWRCGEAASGLADNLGCRWFWSSARTGENLEDLFFELGAKLCEPIVARYSQGRLDAQARPRWRPPWRLAQAHRRESVGLGIAALR